MRAVVGVVEDCSLERFSFKFGFPFRIFAKPLDLPFFGILYWAFAIINKGDFGTLIDSIGAVLVEYSAAPEMTKQRTMKYGQSPITAEIYFSGCTQPKAIKNTPISLLFNNETVQINRVEFREILMEF